MIVSITLPIYNAEEYLEECFQSILKQKKSLENSEGTVNFEVEVSIYEDGSSDSSPDIIDKWVELFGEAEGFLVKVSRNESGSPKGVGYGRNVTIKQSTGEYICFCDADDIMEDTRIAKQLQVALGEPSAIIGSKFRRTPEDSTRNFTTWANSISQDQLLTQIYLSFGPSVVMPTWFCKREVYDKVEGGFDETGKGTPEDLIFFYKHLDLGGKVRRVDEELVVYRYHPNATTFSVTDEVVRGIRLERLEAKVLFNWEQFTIWNAGKLGRRFYRSLSKSSQQKVKCFCDVDKKKITQKFYHPCPIKVKVPIIHVKDATPPLVICVKTELTFDENGDFRKLLDSLNLREGVDYFYFN